MNFLLILQFTTDCALHFVLSMTFNHKKRLSCRMFLHHKSICMLKLNLYMYITFCGVLVTFDPFTVCYLSCLQTSFRVSRKQLVSMPSLQEMTSWYLITPSLLTSKINERKMQEDCCITHVVTCTSGLLSGLVSCKAILLHVAF